MQNAPSRQAPRAGSRPLLSRSKGLPKTDALARWSSPSGSTQKLSSLCRRARPRWSRRYGQQSDVQGQRIEAWISARVGGDRPARPGRPTCAYPSPAAVIPQCPLVMPGCGLGEITLDAPLLDHRVGAGHGPAPPMRRKAAPKLQRQHQAKGPGDHQDDPDRVDVEPRGRGSPPDVVALVGRRPLASDHPCRLLSGRTSWAVRHDVGDAMAG